MGITSNSISCFSYFIISYLRAPTLDSNNPRTESHKVAETALLSTCSHLTDLANTSKYYCVYFCFTSPSAVLEPFQSDSLGSGTAGAEFL